MKIIVGTLWIVVFFFASSTETIATSEKRIALVIGNSTYSTLRELPNPTNDAKAIASKLREANFTVVEVYNATLRDMRTKIREFQNKSRNADVKLLFYAGHGMQSKDQNYIIPVDAEIEESDDVWRFSYDLQDLIGNMTVGGGLNIVLLDACRDNPYTSSNAYRSARGLKVQGFSAMVGGSADQMILFATAAGDVASDGSGTNSPFTNAVLENIDKPGLEFKSLVTRVVKAVSIATDNKQRPWSQGSLSRSFFFHPKRSDPLTEEKDWAEAKAENSINSYQLFKDAYPEGRFVALADDKIAKIMDERAWTSAGKANTIDEYTAYLKVETNKIYRRDARLAIKKIDDTKWKRARKANEPSEIRAYLADDRLKANRTNALAALRKLDDYAWQRAGQKNSVRSYKEYISIWDDNNDALDGEYLAIAKDRIEKQLESEAWSLAQTVKTTTAYGDYLNQYSTGSNADEARKILAILEEDLWTRAKHENLAIRYRTYYKQKYFQKHKLEALRLWKETEAEELWQSADLGQLDRSVKTVPDEKGEVLNTLVNKYPGTPAAGRAEKLMAHYSKSKLQRRQFSSKTRPGYNNNSDVGDCDSLAANPNDPMRVGNGMSFRYVDPLVAIPACLEAVRANPSTARFKYQLARAYQKSADPSQAVPLFNELTSSESYAAAYDNLGWLYYKGNGVPRSTQRAVELFEKGAAVGSSDAMYSLGLMYQKSRNYDKARHWYKQAALQGHGAARKGLRRLPRYAANPPGQNYRRNNSNNRTQQSGSSMSRAEREAQQRLGLEVMKGVFGIILNKTNRR